MAFLGYGFGKLCLNLCGCGAVIEGVCLATPLNSTPGNSGVIRKYCFWMASAQSRMHTSCIPLAPGGSGWWSMQPLSNWRCHSRELSLL